MRSRLQVQSIVFADFVLFALFALPLAYPGNSARGHICAKNRQEEPGRCSVKCMNPCPALWLDPWIFSVQFFFNLSLSLPCRLMYPSSISSLSSLQRVLLLA